MASSSERERLWAAVKHEERNGPARAQKHLRWTMRGPFSSYSCLETHMGGITPSEPRIEAPISPQRRPWGEAAHPPTLPRAQPAPSHAACSRPSSAVTLAGESCGAYRVSSADSRSGSPTAETRRGHASRRCVEEGPRLALGGTGQGRRAASQHDLPVPSAGAVPAVHCRLEHAVAIARA